MNRPNRPDAISTHIDLNKLGRFERIAHRITGDRTGQSNSRGVGWEFVHVVIDDASRVGEKAVNRPSVNRRLNACPAAINPGWAARPAIRTFVNEIA